MLSKSNIVYISAIIFTAFCFFLSLKRDYANMNDGYSIDLRKRIVGVRYQIEGFSPYFFKWKDGMPERLCNPVETDSTLHQNVVTLTPSFMWLLEPIAKLNFYTIEKFWLCIQYFGLFFIGFIFFIKKKKLEYRLQVLAVIILFSFSKGWIFNCDIGQTYIIFPMLWSIPFLFNSSSSKFIISSAIIIAISIWLRPLCALLCIPFLLSEYKKKFFLYFIITALICVMQIVLSGHLNLWQEYFQSTSLWTSYYSQYSVSGNIGVVEGIGNSLLEGRQFRLMTVLDDYQANIPLNLYFLTGYHLQKSICFALLCLLIAIPLYYIFAKKLRIASTVAWLVGFFLCYLGEILIPIGKPSYYFVEFIFPALVVFSITKKNRISFILLSFSSLCLSTLFIKIIPMQILLAEYLLAAMLISFTLKQTFSTKESIDITDYNKEIEI